MKREGFSTANVPPFDDAERAAIQAEAHAHGLDALHCPRDRSRLLAKRTDSGLAFGVQCLECHRWALTLTAPRAEA
jgi:hypothetical protein